MSWGWILLILFVIYVVVGWPLHTKFMEMQERAEKARKKMEEHEGHHTDDPHNEIMAEDFFLAEDIGEEN